MSIYKRTTSIVGLQERLTSMEEHKPNLLPHSNALGSDLGQEVQPPHPAPLRPWQFSPETQDILVLMRIQTKTVFHFS